MNKIVVYTAIVGNYDAINQPKLVDDRFDYVLFSNDISQERVGVWHVRSIPYSNEDKTRIARWVKTHPEEVLDDYECSIWIDGRVVIKSELFYEKMLALYNDGCLVASLNHPQRDCIYTEMVEVIRLRLEKECVILNYGKKLVNEHYPLHNGLCETRVLYRRHTAIDIIKFDCLWWNIIESYSRRDQLSFNYVLWKMNMVVSIIGLGGIGERDGFYVETHKNAQNRTLLDGNISILLKFCFNHPHYFNEIVSCYYKIYHKKHSLLWANIYGFVYKIKCSCATCKNRIFR